MEIIRYLADTPSHASSAGWTRVKRPPQPLQTKNLHPHLSHISRVPFSTNLNVRMMYIKRNV